MANTYKRAKKKYGRILYTCITVITICAIFLTIIFSFYNVAEKEAYDTLHLQTKQIKDDISLQLKSDRENLITLASFASKLYAGGEDYSLMFDSFKPIGLFSRIGILTPDEEFITKDETYQLKGKISFEEQALLREHITGRTYSYSIPDQQVVRSSVPIRVNGETVGIMYGIIKIDDINKRYNEMAEELDAQLFVYDKSTGKFIIDTIDNPLSELSQLKTRKYNKGYSYEQFLNSEKGFSSFKSIRTGEDLYIHYSTMEDFNWGIILARYESQVFAEIEKTLHGITLACGGIILIMAIYLRLVLKNERNRTKLNEESAAIRKLLLDVNEQYTNITEAIKNIREFADSRSAFFVDTDGEDFHFVTPELRKIRLKSDERRYFHSELFGYAARISSNENNSGATVDLMRITPDKHLSKTNRTFYDFMLNHNIKEVTFAIITDKNNHVGILGAINPARSEAARELIEDIAICFSMAIFNKKHLSKTTLAATTDSLTGAMNRVAYKKDINKFDFEKPEDFCCVYIDVNELHIRNNKYGHAAGDEMLIFIANTLKEIFYGNYIYRMGGDEFLVFAENTSQEEIKNNIAALMDSLKIKGYNVAIGTSFRSRNTDCEEMVREAEIRMYEAKAQYYQNKENTVNNKDSEEKYIFTKTGIREIDTMISVMKEHYNGIYRVTLENDNAHRILMPAHLGYKEEEENFSKLLSKYIDENVHPDYHRAIVSFLNYDAVKRQISEGKTPSITYKKINGGTITLSVYSLNDDDEAVNETLWVFSRE